MILNKKLLLLIFALSVWSSFAQSKTTMPNYPVPGNIKLLPGYIHTPGRGIDTAVGKITKANGMEIFYDIGAMAGNYARGALDKKESLAWSKEFEVNNQKLLIVYLKDGSIYANISPFANFTAVTKTNEDLADFLIMMMSYGSAKENKPAQ